MPQVKNAVITTVTVLAVIFIARQWRPLERIIQEAIGL